MKLIEVVFQKENHMSFLLIIQSEHTSSTQTSNRKLNMKLIAVVFQKENLMSFCLETHEIFLPDYYVCLSIVFHEIRIICLL